MTKSTNCDSDRREDVVAAAPFVHRPISSRNRRKKPLLALPQSANDRADFDDLPRSLIADVVPQILSFCDARSLSRASCVSRSWSAMANANELWTELCVATFGVAPWELKPSPDPTRILYIMSHMKLRETLGGAGMRGSRGWGGTRGGGGVRTVSASAVRRFDLFRTNG
eukprot:CAMPEP_0172541350 /NCGR_PEP_ID=MMETSP1067-20121228/12175_1 /TAXON_ID=265564 ORGANISM="Thalassiosira punctigera, Strain Tpunct2005C2" /NCGR_SAMPLE_ID=MMETSP1067 /ASSEMBLY_ACC=CAM_ASM_000444 /LENGTH=168 /DNA_ID=CAMNT_0013327373 /DNA_START=103 /DNA_END=609 /DNA_ORIENTATION=-